MAIKMSGLLSSCPTCMRVACLAAQAALYMWSQCQARQQASSARASRQGESLGQVVRGLLGLRGPAGGRGEGVEQAEEEGQGEQGVPQGGQLLLE